VLLADLGTFIADAGHGVEGSDLFLGTMPSDPSECCALIEYSGEPPLRTQNEGSAHSSAQGGERPRVQLLCRSAEYETGRSLVQAITETLDAVRNETIEGTWYTRIAAIQSPFLVERDENDRYVFACNFQIVKRVG